MRSLVLKYSYELKLSEMKAHLVYVSPLLTVNVVSRIFNNLIWKIII
jgi:hypothetical protein